LDVFTKIKEEIDKFVNKMKAQQAEEVEHRDFCNKNLNENNRSQTAAYEKNDNFRTVMADLEKQIETLTDKLKTIAQETVDNQYEESAGGKRVLAMLDDVMKDPRTSKTSPFWNEEAAQAAHENFTKDSNNFIIQSTHAIYDTTEAKAQAESELLMARMDLGTTMTELFGLPEEAGDLHKSCDFLLNNFELRQRARSVESDALKEVKNNLSGMK